MSTLPELYLWQYFFPFLAVALGAAWRVFLGHNFSNNCINRYSPRGVRIGVGIVVALGIAFMAIPDPILAVVVAAGAFTPLIMAMGGWHEFSSIRQSWPVLISAGAYALLGGDWAMGIIWLTSCLMARAYFPIKTEIYRGQSEPPWVHKLGEALLGGSHIGLIAFL